MPEAVTRPDTPDDEIDLRELMLTLWEARVLIGVIAVVVLALAAAYAFLWPPTYEADARLLPPTQSDIASYNMAFKLLNPALAAAGNAGREDRAAITPVPELSTKDAYAAYLRQLQSASVREQFFQKLYVPAMAKGAPDAGDAEREQLWDRLNKQLTVQPPNPQKPDSGDVTEVKFQGKDPAQLADWTNAYLQMAQQATAKQLVDNLKDSVQTHLRAITDQITSLRASAQNDREYEIARLESALQLARAINLQQPPTSGNLITTYTGSTLYLRGAQALQVELNQLKARTSDDPYIKPLPGLLLAENLLQKIDLDPQNFSAVTIDQPALRPFQPVKPKKALALALGLVLGLALGVMAALIRQAWRAPRAGTAAPAA